MNRYQSALQAVWTWGRKARDLPPIAFDELDKGRETNKFERFLDDDERARLLAALDTPEHEPLRLLVLMALTTGARQSELLRIRWRDIDRKRGSILLAETKNGSTRSVPVVGAVDALLAALPRPLDSEVYLFSASRMLPVFPRKAWDRLLAAAGIEGFRFHDCRHDCASQMAMAGRSTMEIADLLGHRSLEMTKRYSHLSDRSKRETASRVFGPLYG